MLNPSGSIRISLLPVTAHSRATLPVLGGICGETRTRWSGRERGRSVTAEIRTRTGASMRYKVAMPQRVFNETRQRLIADRAVHATSFFQRLVGLMGKKELKAGEALHIDP